MKFPSYVPSEYDLAEFSQRLTSRDESTQRTALVELKEIGESLHGLDLGTFNTFLTGKVTDEPLCIICLAFTERAWDLPERESLQCMAATQLVERFPNSIAHDELMAFMSSPALQKMANAWNTVLSHSPQCWIWYKRAASILIRVDLSKAENCLLSGRCRWPGKAIWAKMLGLLYLQLASRDASADVIHLRRRSLSEFRLCLRLSPERKVEQLAHYCCAGLAIGLGEFEIVERSAISLIRMADMKSECQTGRSAHPGHVFLGLCFLRRGFVQESVEQLFASVQRFKKPSLSATTPFETILAQNLFDHGCQAEALQFLKISREIWDRKTAARIDEWIRLIEDGRIPKMESGFEVFANNA